MTARKTRLVGLATTGALLTGLMAAPPGLAVSARSDGPAFYSVNAKSVGSASRVESVRRASTATQSVSAKTAVAKKIQVLQVFKGTNGVGNRGVTVAAGPKHVVQIGGQSVRILTKSAGQIVKTQQLGQLFGLPGVELSQGTIVYDPLGRRWVAAAAVDDNGDMGLALRVSKGTAPTQWRPAVVFASNDPDNADAVELDPMIGTSKNKVVITTPITDADEPSNVNRIFFFPKSPLMQGQAPSPWTADLDSTYNGQAPAVNASAQDNIFVAIPNTNDVTLTTYTGAATNLEPEFSKSVVFPDSPLTAPPVIDQGAGDDLDLGGLAFSGAAWRAGKLFAAASGNCAGKGCVRLIGLGTAAGVTLIEDEKFKASDDRDWFSPSVAIDGAGYVHTVVTDIYSPDANGPGLAVLTLTKVSLNNTAGPALQKRLISAGGAAFDNNGTPGQTVPWFGSTGAALDPTSPWDVWVTGAVGSATVSNPNLTTKVARVSLAKNVASIKASESRVAKGRKVTFTTKLSRPGGDVIKGLPIALQKKPVHGGHWHTVKSGKTSAKGLAKWTLKIKEASLYRTYGKAAGGGVGMGFAKVYSGRTKVSLK